MCSVCLDPCRMLIQYDLWVGRLRENNFLSRGPFLGSFTTIVGTNIGKNFLNRGAEHITILALIAWANPCRHQPLMSSLARLHWHLWHNLLGIGHLFHHFHCISHSRCSFHNPCCAESLGFSFHEISRILFLRSLHPTNCTGALTSPFFHSLLSSKFPNS